MQIKMRKQSKKIKIAGLDASMSNWGICIGTVDLDEGYLVIDSVHLVKPLKLKSDKKTRQNIKDVLLSQHLYTENIRLLQDIDIICAELPVGSQSARASAGYGICMGIIGALNATLPEIIIVTPQAVKKVVGKKDATKLEVIDWVLDHHPEVNFPTYKQNGVEYISATQAEHMADATVAIYAASLHPTFIQVINQLRESS